MDKKTVFLIAALGAVLLALLFKAITFDQVKDNWGLLALGGVNIWQWYNNDALKAANETLREETQEQKNILNKISNQ